VASQGGVAAFGQKQDTSVAVRGPLHLSTGQEAVAAGVCAHLRPSDYLTSTHRGHGHTIAKGADIARMFQELFGKATGYCGGRGGGWEVGAAARSAAPGAQHPVKRDELSGARPWLCGCVWLWVRSATAMGGGVARVSWAVALAHL